MLIYQVRSLKLLLARGANICWRDELCFWLSRHWCRNNPLTSPGTIESVHRIYGMTSFIPTSSPSPWWNSMCSILDESKYGALGQETTKPLATMTHHCYPSTLCRRQPSFLDGFNHTRTTKLGPQRAFQTQCRGHRPPEIYMWF